MIKLKTIEPLKKSLEKKKSKVEGLNWKISYI
jgi:hypothetical protein